MQKKEIIKISLLALFACFLWSTAFAPVKIGLQYAKPFFFAGVRFVLSAIILLPFCGKLSAIPGLMIKHRRIILILGTFQTFILYSLFFPGMQLVQGSLGAIIIGSSPLFAAIISHFIMTDDKMTVKRTLSLLVGISGIIIVSISRKPWSSAGFKEFIGVLLLITGCIGSVIGNIIVAKDKKNINPVLLNASQMFFGGILLVLFSLPVEGIPRIHYPASFYYSLLWLSSISAAAFSLWFILLKKPGVKVSELNVWKFIIPVTGAIISWIILPDENPVLLQVIGMILVSISILAYHVSGRKKASGLSQSFPQKRESM
ncbi:MAG: DMT family transporter [Spirochaetes bacterium]|nr:DMT family transporter [Spirochaetota bacterium]